MTEYLPALPDEFAGKGLTVDVKDSRYQDVVAFARENGLTQAAFSKLLAVEARAVLARQAAAPVAAAPPPRPAVPTKPYSQMTFARSSRSARRARTAAGRSDLHPSERGSDIRTI